MSFASTSDLSTTPCGHVFHTDCIRRWANSVRSDCPVCRTSCEDNQLIRLYFSVNNATVNYLLGENLTLKTEISNIREQNIKIQKDNERIKGESALILEQNKKLKESQEKNRETLNNHLEENRNLKMEI